MLLSYILASFCYFVKSQFFYPLNRNDDLKETGVGVIRILGVGVGVGVGILGILGVGVGVGPYTFRLRNPGSYCKFFDVQILYFISYERP